MKTKINAVVALAFCSLVNFAVAEEKKESVAEEKKESSDRSLHWTAGAAYRAGMKMDVSGGAYAPAANGHVTRDPNNPTLAFDWDVDTAGQVQLQNGQYYLYVNQPVNGNLGTSDEEAAGVTTALSYDLIHEDRFRLGLKFSLSGFFGMEQKFGRTFYTDRYTFDGLASSFLFWGGGTPWTAGGNYEMGGTYFDSAGNPIPSVDPGSVVSFANSILEIEAKGSLYQFGVGPDIIWDVTDRFHLSLTPALLLNILYLDIDRYERVTQFDQNYNVVGMDEYRDSHGESQFAYGLGLTGNIVYDLAEYLSVYASVGYEYINKAKFECGPSEVEIDCSSLVGSIGLGYNF